VLPCSPSGLPDPGAHRTADFRASSDDASHTATAPSRPIQLRGWFRELDGWLECWKEGVVLQGAWKGLPADGRWLRNNFPTVRLRRRFRQLDGWMVCGQEGLVLPEPREGLPTSFGRLRLSVTRYVTRPSALVHSAPFSGAW